MTVLAAVCTKMPEAKLAIIFLPMFTFTAGNVSAFELQRNPTLKTFSPYLSSIWACVPCVCVSKLLNLFWKRIQVMEVLEMDSELLQPNTVIAQVCSEFRIILNSIILHGAVSNLILRGKRSWEGLRFTCLRKYAYTYCSFWWVIFLWQHFLQANLILIHSFWRKIYQDGKNRISLLKGNNIPALDKYLPPHLDTIFWYF